MANTGWMAEYERLCLARDHAAYRALGAIDAAMCHCRQNNPELAVRVLQDARAQYNRADQALQALKTSSSKKEITDGNRTAAA